MPSPPNTNGFRGLLESPKADASLKEAIAKYPRIEEAWIGDSWRLIRGPDQGTHVAGTVYMMKFASYINLDVDVPGITVLYEYDDENVTVIAVRFSDED